MPQNPANATTIQLKNPKRTAAKGRQNPTKNSWILKVRKPIRFAISKCHNWSSARDIQFSPLEARRKFYRRRGMIFSHIQATCTMFTKLIRNSVASMGNPVDLVG